MSTGKERRVEGNGPYLAGSARRVEDNGPCPKLQHTIIRASAGSGKTYQLANRYIALLLLQALADKPAPDRLVAMTFTRKGAGEFAERILHRLAAAAQNPKDRKQLALDLRLLVNGDPQAGVPGLAPGIHLGVDAAPLGQALASVVDQFDRLLLGTIDSFMARSVQTLAFELGLEAFEILEGVAEERARRELLSDVFRSTPAGELETFFQALKLASLRSSSSLRFELQRFVTGFHQTLHALPAEAAWGGADFWNGAVPARPKLDWRAQANELLAAVQARQWDNKSVGKSLASTLKWLQEREPGMAQGAPGAWLTQKTEDGEIRKGQFLKLWNQWPQGDWDCYYTSKTKVPCRVPAEIMQPLREVLAGWLAAEQAALSEKTAAIYQVISRYETFYDRQARRRGRIGFADLPLLLSGQSAEAAQAAIELLAFRWYQQFDHWLLDEFQDTSRVQWTVLQPWLDEALQDAEGTKSVFVVGDPKQSIYGWRGGEPRLFDDLTKDYPGCFQAQTMAESWRSRPAVLELVNRVCDPERNPALGGDPHPGPLPQGEGSHLARWRYDTHKPELKRAEKPGYAAVLLAPAMDAAGNGAEAGGEEEDEAPLAAQARVIYSVLTQVDPLAKGLSCAILVRKNAHAHAIAQWLRAKGLTNVMVEGDATLADQSPVVAALFDALRWLQTPADTHAGGHIQHTPLWGVLQSDVSAVDASSSPAGRVWNYWRRQVAELGAPAVTAGWCRALARAAQDPYTDYCLRQVEQLALQTGPGLALADWLAAVEGLTVRETAAAGSIHVMSIHKAKGLGFDLVFLPDLDLGVNNRENLLFRRDPQGRPLGCLVTPPRWLGAWVPELETLSAAREADDTLEELCVLYVALTRAKEATFVVLNPERPRGAADAREWILRAVDFKPETLQPAPWGEGQLVWEQGDRVLPPGKETVPGRLRSAPQRLDPPLPRRARKKPSESGHELLGPRRTVLTGPGLEFGTAVHGIFEQIDWWQPGQILEGPKDAVAAVKACLGAQAVRALFTPEHAADEVYSELPLEYIEEETWWSGVLDRLVLRRGADGALLRAELIDFKTDALDTPAAFRKRYAGQLAIYRKAACAALQIKPEQLEVLLVSTHLREVVALGEELRVEG